MYAIRSYYDGRSKIVITEIPYLVNKAEMIAKTAELVNDKKIDGITNVNDESDRTGIRITSYNVCYTKLLRVAMAYATHENSIYIIGGRNHNPDYTFTAYATLFVA